MKYGRAHSIRCCCRDCLNDWIRHQYGQWHSFNKTGTGSPVCTCVDCQETTRTEGRWSFRGTYQCGPIIDEGEDVNRGSSGLNLCERQSCNSFMLGKAVGSVSITSGKTATTIEICPGCVGDMMATLDAGPLSDREQAYKEPWAPTPKTEPVPESAVELARKLLQTVVQSDYAKAIEGTVEQSDNAS